MFVCCITYNPAQCAALPGDVELYRDRRGSVSTQQTEQTERFEIEESTEFLPAVDANSRHIMEDLEYQVAVGSPATSWRTEVPDSSEVPDSC
jgi:hypothetical protein